MEPGGWQNERQNRFPNGANRFRATGAFSFHSSLGAVGAARKLRANDGADHFAPP
jgi:hypothetical protein